MKDRFIPSHDDILHAESALTDHQRHQSNERHEAFEQAKPPHFNTEKCTVLLDVDARLIYTDTLKVFAEQNGYSPKNEFHVTIIGYGQGKRIIEAFAPLSEAERSSRYDDIARLIKRTDWTIDSKQQLWHARKEYDYNDHVTNERVHETRETILQPLTLRLDEFYKSLSGIVGTEITSQFPHITLYTKGTDPVRSRVGIGINSEQEFQSLHPEPVVLDEA